MDSRGESVAQEALISSARSGNRRAFEDLVNPCLKLIYNYIASRVGPEEDRKDIVQETVLSAWTSIGSFDASSAFKTWIIGISRHKIADFYRLSSRNRTVPLSDFEETAGSDDEYEAVLDKTAVNAALSVLTGAERELVFLVFSAELSYGEISAMTGLPCGTIKSRMAAVKEKLRKKIEGR